MRRHDIRLKAFDYRSPGMYLVTLVTDHRARSLAAVADRSIVLLECGMVVQAHLEALPLWRPGVGVLDHVIMPDHVHLVLKFERTIPAGLGGVVNALKGGITREVNRRRGTDGIAFWQYNYWERVIRSERELLHYRRYFADNPGRWVDKYGSHSAASRATTAPDPHSAAR
jgi:putative transposase